MKYGLSDDDEIVWQREDGTMAHYKLKYGSLIQIDKGRKK